MTINEFVNCSPWPSTFQTFFGKILQNISKPSKFIEGQIESTYTIIRFTIEDETCSIGASCFNPEPDIINLTPGTPVTLTNIIQGEWNGEQQIKKCKITPGHANLTRLEPQQIIDSATIRLKTMELATQLVTCPAFANQQVNFSQVLFLATLFSNYAINQIIPEVVAKRIAIFKEAIDIMQELKLEPELWQKNIDLLTNASLEKAYECLLILKIKLEEFHDKT